MFGGIDLYHRRWRLGYYARWHRNIAASDSRFCPHFVIDTPDFREVSRSFKQQRRKLFTV
jgi:hypothetical protein